MLTSTKVRKADGEKINHLRRGSLQFLPPNAALIRFTLYPCIFIGLTPASCALSNALTICSQKQWNHENCSQFVAIQIVLQLTNRCNYASTKPHKEGKEKN